MATLLPRRPAPALLPPCTHVKGKVKRSKAGALTLTIPPEAARELGIPDGVGLTSEVYLALTNGVVQVSAREPSLAIPVGVCDETGFTKPGQGD